MIFDPITATCAKCGNHKATTHWVGDGGSLALVHGAYEFWCGCCCLKAKLEYAKERAAAVPDIERQLAEVRCEEIPKEDTAMQTSEARPT